MKVTLGPMIAIVPSKEENKYLLFVNEETNKMADILDKLIGGKSYPSLGYSEKMSSDVYEIDAETLLIVLESYIDVTVLENYLEVKKKRGRPKKVVKRGRPKKMQDNREE